MDAYEAEQLVYMDESTANEKILDRKYSWAPRGYPAIDIQILHHSTCWSILPILTVNSFLEEMLVTQGSVNGEMFANWLEDNILPQCNPYPGNQLVLILDNCSIHHTEVSFNLLIFILITTNYK